MSVWKRKWRCSSGSKREAWVVDVQAAGKDGKVRRIRRFSRVQTRRAAEKLEHALRDRLLRAGTAETADASEVPTLAEFADRFMDTFHDGCQGVSAKKSDNVVVHHDACSLGTGGRANGRAGRQRAVEISQLPGS
jgi:hypothetical protein